MDIPTTPQKDHAKSGADTEPPTHSKLSSDSAPNILECNKSEILIAHLSDLHCDATTEWKSNFKTLTNKLLTLEPDLIIVTGDLCDEPKNEYYEELVKHLRDLVEKICKKNTPGPFALISIPGNHDYYSKGFLDSDASLDIDLKRLEKLIELDRGLKGKAIRSIGKSVINHIKKLQASAKDQNLFSKHVKKLQFFCNNKPVCSESTNDFKDKSGDEESKSLDGVTKKTTQENLHDKLKPFLIAIFNAFNIAIFPFDSAKPKQTGIMSMGHVEDPSEVLQSLTEGYRSASSNKTYHSCFKIAALHHHPVPPVSDRPITGHDLLEGTLILQNSAEFLQAISEYEIDLVLHGHKHIASCTEYQQIPSDSRNLVISSCGSSCKPGEALHFRTYKLNSDNGSSIAMDFDGHRSASACGLQFRERQKEPYTLISYDSRRRKRYAIREAYPNHEANNSIASVALKRKQVTITADGDAYNQIKMEGICFDQATRPDEIEVTEILRADFGRIARILTTFSQTDTPLDSAPRDRIVTSARDAKQRPPDGSEYLEHTFKPTKHISDPSVGGHCEILALAFNSYAVKESQFHEMYRSDMPAEEVCSIQAHYPTETMELLILFSESVAFPEEHQITVKATALTRNESVVRTSLSTLAGQLPLNSYEDNYLHKNIALRTWPEIKAISLFIRQPQPDVQYTVRWRLPIDDDTKAETSNRIALKADTIRNELLISEPLQQTFYAELSSRVKDIFRKYLTSFRDSDFSLVILGVDYDEWHYLKIAVNSGPYKKNKRMLLNRGIAGKSFRKRSLQYWERPCGTQDYDFLSPENLTENPIFNPTHILSLPIYCPIEGEHSRPPVIGVISIVFQNFNESLSLAMEQMVQEQDSDIAGKDASPNKAQENNPNSKLKRNIDLEEFSKHIDNQRVRIQELANKLQSKTRSGESQRSRIHTQQIQEALERLNYLKNIAIFYTELEYCSSVVFDKCWRDFCSTRQKPDS